MGKENQSLQLNRNPEEINISKNSEEIFKGKSVSNFIEQPMELGGKQKKVSDEKADKKWVKQAMDRLETKAENEQKEKDFARDNLVVSAERLQVRIPANTLLTASYGSAFTERVSDKKRKAAKLNKKSRLFQKEVNAALLEKNLKVAHSFGYDNAKKLIGKNADIDAQDFNDLAQFLVHRDINRNKEIADLMLGGKNKNGKPQVDAHHARLALVKMANQLLSVNLSGIRLDTDHDIAENAAHLEALVNRIAAFERLSDKYDFMATLDTEKRNAINLKLESLRTVAAYFTIRKQIISDKVYKDHYDDELSMDISRAVNLEQLILAKKLTKAYAIGKTMMTKCGVSARNMNKMGVPALSDHTATSFFNDNMREFSGDNTQAMDEILKENYKETDKAAGKVLKDIKGTLVMRQEGDFVVIDQPILSEQQSNQQVQQQQAIVKKFSINDMEYSKLLTADELTPLKGTKQLAAVQNGVHALNAMLSNKIPAADKTQDYDAECLAVTMLYNRIADGLDKLIFTCGNDHPECSNMLKTILEQVKKDNESFREKTLEYLKITSADPELSKKKHTWMDALKFKRGMFYDLDNDRNLSYTVDGAGASVVYRIVRKVPVTKNNPKGEEIVYFRKKDNVPPENNDELVDEVVSRYELDVELAEKVSDALKMIMTSNKNVHDLHRKIGEMKRNKIPEAQVGKAILQELKQNTVFQIEASPSDYEILGRIFKDWSDTFSKRCIANYNRNRSAKIGFGRNLSDRNVATSRMAALFGIQDIICDSRTAMVRLGNQVLEGNIMEDTGGVGTSTVEAAYSPRAISQLFQIQIFDFICGQVDRHFGNFHGILKNGAIDHIKCIDNDMAFGNLKGQEIAKGYNRICPLTYQAVLGLPKIFVDRIMGMDKAYIMQTIGDILNDEEISAVMERLKIVKLTLKNMADKYDGVKWDAGKKKLNYIVQCLH